MTSRVINVRLNEDTLDALDLICQIEKTDRSSIVRKLLEKAIERSRLEYGIKLYQDGKASIEKAAELAKIDIWSFHDEISRLGIIHPSTLNNLEYDLQTIKKRKLDEL